MSVEYKRQFPETARKLSEVVASFASTSGGRIYLGVDNDARVVGLDVDTQTKRDKLQLRIAGCCDQIDPRIRVKVDFIQRNRKTVAVINTPKGSEPIYFVDRVPYIRELTRSRPASASEVEEAHRQHFASMPIEKDKEQEFLEDVLYQLSDIVLISRDFRNHIINPDLSQMLYDIGSSGQILLEFSSQPFAKQLGAENEVTKMGDELISLANHRFLMGSNSVDAFGEMLNEIAAKAKKLQNRIQKRIEPVNVGELKGLIQAELAALRGEWKSAEKYLRSGEFERLWASLRRISFNLARLGSLPLKEGPDLSIRLLELAERTRALTSYEKYFLFASVRDPIARLRQPMMQVLTLASEIETLTGITRD